MLDLGRTLCTALLALVLGACATPAPRLPVPGPAVGDRLFASHEMFALRLEFDQGSVLAEREGDSTYQPAVLTYSDAAGEQARLEIQIRTRGRYRRDRATCSFAPLRLNFVTKQAKGTVFAKQDKLKLVTHCRNSYEQLVLKEHLLYRAYNLLTERSYRVRLAEITYVDSAQKRDPVTRYAFFIEDKGSMAKRNGFVAIEEPKVDYGALERADLNRLEVFAYMVGNTDWSAIRGAVDDDCCHNTTPMRGDNARVVSVPFDFDLAGAVNAPYATPNPDLGLRNVRQRLYRGYCGSDSQLESTLEDFRRRKDDIRALYGSDPRLEPWRAKQMIDYVDQFYETIDDPGKVERSLVRRCRRQPSS